MPPKSTPRASQEGSKTLPTGSQNRSNPSPPGGRKGALNDSILDVILGVILSHLGGHLEAILEAGFPCYIVFFLDNLGVVLC